ncbi:MAG: hypothetical protein JWN17_2056 [Frankiales bacterium]|nr:hypothetical protein [Frankiales bacterium]
MTTLHDPQDRLALGRLHDHAFLTLPPTPPAAPAAPTGDPSLLGLPTFVVGSFALGMAQVGYLPAAAAAGILPIVLAATGLGLLLSTVWAARLGQSTVAGIFGVFAGFWLSDAVLGLGLAHGWFAVPEADVTRVVGLYLISWAAVIGLLTVSTVRLPAAFTLLLGLVTVALTLAALGALLPSTSLAKVGGVVVLAFAALGAYLFVGASDAALGGPGYPLGRPLQR